MSNICDGLRAAILQAAMQGKLTGSDNESWNESKIEDVCELCTGNSISESIKKTKYMKVAEGRNYIGTKDLGFDHSFNYENGVKIPFDETSFRVANCGDILLCIEGGSAGRKIGILEEDVNYGNKLCRFSPNNKLNNRFLYFYIQSPLFQEQFSDSMTGIIGGVSIKKIKAITIVYPDVAEQERIAKKVDELMTRVAVLEQSADALASLKEAFPDDIKASLLQYTMQGKLTKQLPEDGNAGDLLEKIKAEKEKLIAEGKIKKQKPLTPITDDEVPFSIPENWKWVRMDSIFNIHSSIRIHQSDWKTSGIPFFRGRELVKLAKNGDVDPEIFISKELYEENKRKGGVPQKDDILVSAVGTIGKAYIVKGDRPFYYKDAYVLCFDNIGNIIPQFIKYAIEAPSINDVIMRGSMGTTVAQLTIDKAKNLLLPLPPISEQKRIVERLDVILQNINAVGELIASE